LDTRGTWPKAFLLHENAERFSTPADGHRGGLYYHAALLLVLFVPWSAFLIPTFWAAVREARRPRTASDIETAKPDVPGKYRFLLAWFAVYLVVFSVAATKLPNYILPLYPALAILTGRMLDRWRLGTATFPRWVMRISVGGLAITGIVFFVGLLFVAGRIPSPVPVKGFHALPALAEYAPLGAIPAFVSVLFGWLISQARRDEAVTAFAAGAVAFLALLAALPTVAMDEYKAPKYLAEEVGLLQPDKDIRIAAIGWYRHSTVFYVRREVSKLHHPNAVDPFLALPRPAYLIVPEPAWPELSKSVTVPTRVIGRRYDFYSRQVVLVIANRYATGE
jgi:4-amino-4-deoxy-L-arabinose transferase-like glycosyltransferase